MLEIRFHGYGGEGIVTLAELLAAAALATGKKVQSMPSFGVERRGSPVKALLRISEEEIWVRSECYQPDILFLSNEKLLDMAIEQGIKPDGKIIANSSNSLTAAYPITTIDATKIAIEEGLTSGGLTFINVPLAGAGAAFIGLPWQALADVIKQKWSGRVAENNIAVAQKTYNMIAGRG